MRLTLALCVLLSAGIAIAETPKVQISGRSYATGYLPLPKDAVRPYAAPAPFDASELPEAYDSREHGYVTPIKDQGNCGSCWSFARTKAFEAALLVAGKVTLIDLAEQDALVNDQTAYGCDGGFMDGRFETEKGVTTEALCPYKARDNVSCSGAKFAKATRWAMLPGSPTDNELRAAIYQYKVLFVTVAAGGGFDPGSDGRITTCGSRSVNHMVTLVGYRPAPGGGVEYLIGNSWGTSWGDDGFAWSKKGCNKLASTSGDAAGYFYVESDVPPPPPPPPPPPAGPSLLPIEIKVGKGVETAIQVKADVPGRKCRWSTGEKGCRIWVKPETTAAYTLEVTDPGKEPKGHTTTVVPQ